MNWRDEFPDYSPAEMPAIPPGFDDTSWRNNVCPSFTSDPLGLTLWIDYAAPAEREFPTWPRYRLESQEAGVEVSGFYLESDDFALILAAISNHTKLLGDA
jgi:hypothetical protein